MLAPEAAAWPSAAAGAVATGSFAAPSGGRAADSSCCAAPAGCVDPSKNPGGSAAAGIVVSPSSLGRLLPATAGAGAAGFGAAALSALICTEAPPCQQRLRPVESPRMAHTSLISEGQETPVIPWRSAPVASPSPLACCASVRRPVSIGRLMRATGWGGARAAAGRTLSLGSPLAGEWAYAVAGARQRRHAAPVGQGLAAKPDRSARRRTPAPGKPRCQRTRRPTVLPASLYRHHPCHLYHLPSIYRRFISAFASMAPDCSDQENSIILLFV